IDGGLALFRGAYDQSVSLDWLAGTPFTEYRTPALALMIVVGGSALLAATTAFVHREWALLVSAACGLVLVGYLLVEVVTLDAKVGDAFAFVVALQVFYFVLGLAMLGQIVPGVKPRPRHTQTGSGAPSHNRQCAAPSALPEPRSVATLPPASSPGG